MNKWGGGQISGNYGCRTEKRKKNEKKNEESLRELWDNVKHTNIHIIGMPEGEEREKGKSKIFQEIIAKNFPNMGKEPLTQIQEAQWVNLIK